MFSCSVKNTKEIKLGPQPDNGQIGLEWIDLNKVSNYNIYPKLLVPLLTKDETKRPVYLGYIS